MQYEVTATWLQAQIDKYMERREVILDECRIAEAEKYRNRPRWFWAPSDDEMESLDEAEQIVSEHGYNPESEMDDQWLMRALWRAEADMKRGVKKILLTQDEYRMLSEGLS